MTTNTSDWSDAAVRMFSNFFVDGASSVLAVLNYESGLMANPHGPGPAAGLAQIMDLPAVGWTEGKPAFEALTVEEQLPYVFRYFAPYRSKIDSVASAYLALFAPAYLAHAQEPDFVVYADDPRMTPGRDPYVQFYRSNLSFDPARKGYITVQDLVDTAMGHLGARYQALLARMGLSAPTMRKAANWALAFGFGGVGLLGLWFLRQGMREKRA